MRRSRRVTVADPLDSLLEGLTGAERVIRFFEGALVHPKPPFAGQPFKLTDWQVNDIIRPIFGTLRPDGLRQYRRALVMMAKKNGKSNLAAGVALYLTFADGEVSGEIASAAGDRDQASIVFDLAADMVEFSPMLKQRAIVRRAVKRIVDRKTRSVYRAISAEAGTKHGPNWSGIVFDELHTQPNRELWDTLTTGNRARKQPLTLGISTAGWDRQSICYEQYDYSKRVSADEIEDPTFFSRIYEVPEDADWRDESTWPMANPGLGTAEDIAAGRAFLDIQSLRDDCRLALSVPSYQNTFQRLSCNQWTSQESRWLPMDRWRECGGAVDPVSLRSRLCFGGLDLSSTTDISALMLTFPDNNGEVTVLPFFWIPQDRMEERSRRDGVPYAAWCREGLIEATPGNVIDYGYIKAKLNDLAELYQISEIAYDPHNATQLVVELSGDGFEMIPLRQGFLSLSPPAKELERLVLAGKIRHGGNKVLEWMADNVMVLSDAAGNIKPDKSRSKDRIDGIAALVNSLDRLMRHVPQPKEYKIEWI